jgi:N-acetylmuramic acid 6-phosphate etherase
MARMGRLASNWMAYVEPTNKKLIDRGTRLVSEIAGVDYATACFALHETIEELARSAKPGQERPSPVALTIARLKGE